MNNDLISRQAAISAVGYCQTYLFDSRDKDKKISLEDAEYAIEQLPSAKHEPCEDAVSRKYLLEEYDRQHKGEPGGARRIIENAPSVTPKPAECEDAVSRQAVLDAINNPLNVRLDVIIKNLPSVTPKSKTGRWEDISPEYHTGMDIVYHCNTCKEYYTTAPREMHYCPNCGAKMEEQDANTHT